MLCVFLTQTKEASGHRSNSGERRFIPTVSHLHSSLEPLDAIQVSEVWVPQQAHGYTHRQRKEGVEDFGQNEVDEAVRLGVVRGELRRVFGRGRHAMPSNVRRRKSIQANSDHCSEQ